MHFVSPWTITVIIPTYRPGGMLEELLQRLMKQELRPDRILIVNTQEELFPADLSLPDIASVHHIRKEEFDHGGTRDLAASMCDTDLLVFMTQDAFPAGPHLLEYLTAPFEDEKVAAVYARQIPAKDASVEEVFTRKFNYPAQDHVYTKEDLPEKGIKTYFCSNVCAAYRRSVYRELGGFEKNMIFNEDMVFAAKMINAGWAVAYASKARVVHSHNYTALMQLKRNFDLGVSQKDHAEVFEQVPSEGEGKKLVKSTARFLLTHGKFYRIPHLVWVSGFKYLGYRLGKNYRALPKAVIRALTNNPGYWETKV